MQLRPTRHGVADHHDLGGGGTLAEDGDAGIRVGVGDHTREHERETRLRRVAGIAARGDGELAKEVRVDERCQVELRWRLHRFTRDRCGEIGASEVGHREGNLHGEHDAEHPGGKLRAADSQQAFPGVWRG